jgi:hypothetical protein
MNFPILAIIGLTLICVWLSALSYFAWFRPDRLVPPLWHARNTGYDLWITRLVAPIAAAVLLVFLVRVLLCRLGFFC